MDKPSPVDAKTESNKRPRSNDDDSAKPNDVPPEKEAITADGEMPQKRFYRSRAHCNPLSHNNAFTYPSNPDLYNWSEKHYPNFICEEKASRKNTPIAPSILDIGCGFGGLTVALATLYPTKLVLGCEIRAKVTEYVRLRILALRKQNEGQYENCSVLKSNTMKHMPNFFRKQSLEKIFFCFPDPHFKKKNHCRRIVSERLLSEYAYFLKPGGRLYTITDVEDLHNWHVKHCRSHPMFREMTDDELENDPCVKAMHNETEEGKKVERAGTNKYYTVYERLDSQTLSDTVTAENFWDDSQFGVSRRQIEEQN